jgi:hypothetical protein
MESPKDEPMKGRLAAGTYVWGRLEAYLAESLEPDDRAHVERLLAQDPESQRLVASERHFQDVLRRCIHEPVECPPGLRDRIRDALDRCEREESAGRNSKARLYSLSWFPAGALAAASVALAAALVFFLAGPAEPESPDWMASLQPVLAGVSMHEPVRDSDCLYPDAAHAYRLYFADAPELPREFGGRQHRVVHFQCDELNGRRVMCAVYLSPEGERFALMVFSPECLGKSAPAAMDAAEVRMGDKRIIMWRDGKYFRALVADGLSSAPLRHVEQLRRAA